VQDGLIETTDVSSLAQVLAESRRARIGLPILIGARAGLSTFALAAGGAPIFQAASWVALLSSGLAAAILLVYDPANIRGRRGLRRFLLAYFAICIGALAFDAAQAARIVVPALLSGSRISMADDLGNDGLFVLMFVLLSWLIAAVSVSASKALRAPMSERDRAILAAAQLSLPTVRMGVRNAFAWIAAAVFTAGLMMVIGTLRQVPYGDVVDVIRKEGLLKMARELAVGVERGETAAIGVTVILMTAAAILLLKVHSMLFPRRAPLNRMWRWARDAKSALATDPRRLVLLLRSFADGAALVVEDAIGRAVAASGPFIAIGVPGEAAPEGRAYRTYLGDDEWQTAVLRWIGESQRIVVVLGTTKWVRWEIDNIRAQEQLGKTLVMVPRANDEDRALRWATLEAACAATPWQGALAAIAERTSVLLVEFKPSGKLGVVRSARSGVNDYHAAVLAALCSPP
jgi:hypothetical protein